MSEWMRRRVAWLGVVSHELDSPYTSSELILNGKFLTNNILRVKAEKIQSAWTTLTLPHDDAPIDLRR